MFQAHDSSFDIDPEVENFFNEAFDHVEAKKSFIVPKDTQKLSTSTFQPRLNDETRICDSNSTCAAPDLMTGLTEDIFDEEFDVQENVCENKLSSRDTNVNHSTQKLVLAQQNLREIEGSSNKLSPKDTNVNHSTQKLVLTQQNLREIEGSSNKLSSKDTNVNHSTQKLVLAQQNLREIEGSSNKLRAIQSESPLALKTCASPIILGHTLASENSTPKRKFPGPAGLLPHLDRLSKSAKKDNEKPKLLNESQDLIWSLERENYFSSPAWNRMKEDLKQNDDDSSCIIKRFNLSWISKQACLDSLPEGKIPILIVLLKSLRSVISNAKADFIDASAEIQGTIHQKILKKYTNLLIPGAVLVLHQVSLFSPSPKKHHLNIIPNNLLRIYSPVNSDDKKTVHCALISNTKSEDIIKICSDSVKMLLNPKDNSKVEAAGHLRTDNSVSCVERKNFQRPTCSKFDCQASKTTFSSPSLPTTKEFKDFENDDDLDALLRDLDDDEFFNM